MALGHMGKHGIGKRNSNCELLLALRPLCSEFELIGMNTMFKELQTLMSRRDQAHQSVANQEQYNNNKTLF